jgi:hypothetical protein
MYDYITASERTFQKWLYEACSNEPCSGIVLGEGVEALKIVPMRAEVGVLLMHQLIDRSAKNFLGCCCNQCTTAALMSLPGLNLWPFNTFLWALNTFNSEDGCLLGCCTV